eukprot:3755634-Rhodomonas_salina.2
MNLKGLLKSVKALFSQTPKRIGQAIDEIKSHVELEEAGCMACRHDQNPALLVSGKRARASAIHTKAVRGIRDLDVNKPGVKPSVGLDSFPKPEDFPKPIALSHAAPVYQVGSNRGAASMSQASTVQGRSPVSSAHNSRDSSFSMSRVPSPADSAPAHRPVGSPMFLRATAEAPPPLPAGDNSPVSSLSRAPTFFSAIAEYPPSYLRAGPRVETTLQSRTEKRPKTTTATVAPSATAVYAAKAEAPPLSLLHANSRESTPSPVHNTAMKSKQTPPFVFKPAPGVVLKPPPMTSERKCKSCESAVDRHAKVCEVLLVQVFLLSLAAKACVLHALGTYLSCVTRFVEKISPTLFAPTARFTQTS